MCEFVCDGGVFNGVCDGPCDGVCDGMCDGVCDDACGWFLDSAGNRVSFVYLLTDKQIEKNCYFR